jgi:hypothetical protein
MNLRDTYAGEESGPVQINADVKVMACRKKFLRFFPKGFEDAKYVAWERGYKVNAHEEWEKMLNKVEFEALLRQQKYVEIATRAVRIESRTNFLFSFEKMALRDALKSRTGARQFAKGLYHFLHGEAALGYRFERWLLVVQELPRKQTRVFTWPVVTVFGFIAQPGEHIFLKPMVTKKAAAEIGFAFEYHPTPSWSTYENLLRFGETIHKISMSPKDQIDVQSFIWVLGSDEYAS